MNRPTREYCEPYIEYIRKLEAYIDYLESMEHYIKIYAISLTDSPMENNSSEWETDFEELDDDVIQ